MDDGSDVLAVVASKARSRRPTGMNLPTSRLRRFGFGGRLSILFIAAICSALIRVLAASVAGEVPSGDPQIFLQLAENIANDEGMRRYSPTLGIEVLALHPPLYPLILSAFVPNVALANFLIDLLGAAALLWLARACRIRGEFSASLYLILTVWPSAIPHKEGLVAALVMASAAAAIDKRPIVLGFFGAMLALAQPGLALFVALLAAAFAPPRLWPAIALVSVAVMLPWWIRNWAELGAFVPLTTSSGYGLWLGAFAEHRWTPLPSHLLVGSELGISRAAATEAMVWIAANPLVFVAGSLSRALPLAAPFILIAGISSGKLRLVLALTLLNLFAFQMWFELGARHFFHLLPIALLALEGIIRSRAEKHRSTLVAIDRPSDPEP